MPVLQNIESAEGRELWKWDHTVNETHPSDPQIRGMRPETPQTFPRMMYKLTSRNPMAFESHEVGTETEQRNLESRGYVTGGKGAALEAYDEAQQAVAVGAAVRAAEDRTMSPKAQAEAEAYEATTSEHVAEVPEAHKRPRAKPKR